jgi:hypothetical protein
MKITTIAPSKVRPHGFVVVRNGNDIRSLVERLVKTNSRTIPGARVGMMLALLGAVPIPEHDASKVKHCRRHRARLHDRGDAGRDGTKMKESAN